MGLVAQEAQPQVKKPRTPAKGKTTTAAEYTKATAWLNMNIVRSDKSTFKIKRGTAIVPTEDMVLDALEKSERKYRDECVAKGIPYVARKIHIEATVQLVDAPAEIPDLFE
jgi:hypothetical protein